MERKDIAILEQQHDASSSELDGPGRCYVDHYINTAVRKTHCLRVGPSHERTEAILQAARYCGFGPLFNSLRQDIVYPRTSAKCTAFSTVTLFTTDE